MTTEELRIKITADTSDLKRSVSKAKRDIEGIGSGADGVTKSTQGTVQSMEELADVMGQIRAMNFFTLLKTQSKDAKKYVEYTITSWKDFKEQVKESRKQIGLVFKDIRAGINVTGKGQIGNFKEMGVNISDAWLAAKEAMRAFWATAKWALSSVIAKAAALLAVVGTLAVTIRNSLRVSLLAKQTNVLAQQAGMSADAYQRWAFVLGQVGLEVDDMIGAQQTLLEAQMDVREGTEEIIAAFKRIGLSEKEVMSMNQQQLFEKTVEGLQKVENATERATIAQRLLSEDAKNLAPLLNLTSEQVATLANNFDTLNGAMSEGLIKNSNRLQASVGNLRAAWQGLKNTLAELVLPVIISVVNWLTKAIAIVNLFVRTIFGLDIGGAASSGMDKATNNVGGYTESVEKATGAAAKLKRVLMGFDELNVVGNPNSGSSAEDEASAGIGGAFGGGFTDSLFSADALNMSKYQEWFAKYKTMIQDITTWGLIGIGVGTAVLGALTGNIPLVIAGLGLAGIGFAVGNVDDGTFDRLRQKFKDMNMGLIPAALVGIGSVGAVIALLMGNIPAAIGLAAMAGIGFSLGGGKDIKQFVQKYESAIKGVVAPSMIAVGAIVAPLALMLGNIPLALAGLALIGGGLALGALSSGGSIKQYVDDYGANINRAVTIATAAASGIACMICLLTGNIPGAIAFGVIAGISLGRLASSTNVFKEAVENIKGVWRDLKSWFSENVAPKFTREYWAQKFDTIKQGATQKLEEVKTSISTKWENLKAWFATNVTPKFTKQYWITKFDTIRAAASEKIEAAKQAITQKWASLKSWFSVNVAPKFTKQYWITKFDTIRTAASEKLEAAKSTIQGVWNKLTTWFTANVKPKFTIAYWTQKFGTIKDGAKAAFNGVISVVENAVNGIIRKVNTLSWTIPDWVPKFGGDKFGFNFRTISIPRLATGGIAVGSTLANIGERGKEAILPLENNTGWMDMLADRIAQRSSAPTKLVLKVGERELGWATINGINQITRQTGELQLVL